jgi:soluble lytic murein transglycosylase-like protein
LLGDLSLSDTKVSLFVFQASAAWGTDSSLSFDQVSSIVSIFNRSGQSDKLVISLIWKESRFDYLARPDDPNSTATGLMQMTKTAVREVNRIWGTNISHSSMTDPVWNVVAGTGYLRIAIERKGGLIPGLNYYGTGPGYADSILRAANALGRTPNDPMAALRSVMP